MRRHSPMARRVSTATTPVPPAPVAPPTTAPMPTGVSHFPWHCTLTKLPPMAAPAAPPNRIAANARARALGDGSADTGRAGGPDEELGEELDEVAPDVSSSRPRTT